MPANTFQKVFAVGIYHGYGKPESSKALINYFVQELKVLPSFKYLCISTFNQDCLKNTFGIVRGISVQPLFSTVSPHDNQPHLLPSTNYPVFSMQTNYFV